MKSIFIDFPAVTHAAGLCLQVRYDAARETLHLRNVTEIALFALVLSEVALVGLKAAWEMTQAVLGKRIRQIIALKRERRKSRARLNAGRCHFVWPFWELPLCMTRSMSACHWDSLGLLLLLSSSSSHPSSSRHYGPTQPPDARLPSNWPDHGQ